jgi:hypothetical protein
MRFFRAPRRRRHDPEIGADRSFDLSSKLGFDEEFCHSGSLLRRARRPLSLAEEGRMARACREKSYLCRGLGLE